MTTTTGATDLKRRKSSLHCLWKNSEQFVLQIYCPDNSSLTVIHHIKETCSNVLFNACSRLGIADQELFGLALFKRNEYQFLSGNKSLSKIFPRWAIVTGQTLSDSDTCCNVADTMIKTCKLYLRLIHYVTNLKILHPSTLYNYFQQLRYDSIKIQNLLSMDGYEDENFRLAFYSLLATPADSPTLEEKSSYLNYFPRDVVDVYTVDEIASMLVKYSQNVVEISAIEAQVCFIRVALKMPAVASYLFQVDIVENRRITVSQGVASLSSNSLRIFEPSNGKWRQLMKWDMQEIDEVRKSKRTVTVAGLDCEGEVTTFRMQDSMKAKHFVKLYKDIQGFDESSFVDGSLTVQCAKFEHYTGNQRSLSSSECGFIRSPKFMYPKRFSAIHRSTQFLRQNPELERKGHSQESCS